MAITRTNNLEQHDLQIVVPVTNLQMISGSRELEKVRRLGNNSEEAATAKKMLVKVKESAHPGFAVIFDNIDLEIKTKNMT